MINLNSPPELYSQVLYKAVEYYHYIVCLKKLDAGRGGTCL